MAQAQKLMEKGKVGVQPARDHQQGRHYRRRPDGQRHRPCRGALRLHGGLNDLKKEAFDKGSKPSARTWRASSPRARSRNSDRDKTLERISFAPTLEAFGDCDLVIEAATEDEALKHKIFAALCPHLKPTAMLASNTSSISITRLAATTDRPEDFIGMHFMNPVPVMELVELIRGIATDDETFATARAFVESLGKTTACRRRLPGLHRQPHPAADDQRGGLHALRRRRHGRSHRQGDEAWRASSDGAARACRFYRPRYLPRVMQVLYEGLSDSKYRPCPLLVKYVEAGWLGRKTKRGFYDYRGEKPVPTR